MAKIIIGEAESRVIPVKAVQPLNNDKTTEHRFTVEVEILDADDWRAITERWDYLGDLSRKERHAQANGLDYEPMTDDEREESKRPLIDSVKHLVKHIDLEVEDKNGKALTGSAAVDAVVKIPWLRDPILDAILAVQAGKTMDAFKKARQKNS